MDRKKDMWECTYCNSLKISRVDAMNGVQEEQEKERERRGNNSLKRTREEEENRSDIMVFAMYNFANICLPFLLLQLLEQALRSCTSTCRKKTWGLFV